MNVMEHVQMIQTGMAVCDELEIAGCQDSLAVNYNSLATDSNPDLCDYLGCTDQGSILNMIQLLLLMMDHVKL